MKKNKNKSIIIATFLVATLGLMIFSMTKASAAPSAADLLGPGSSVVSQGTAAQTAIPGSSGPYKNQEKIPGAPQTSDFVTYLKQIINFGFAIIGILALFMLIIGAYQYLMAAGSGNSSDAKETISSALLGLILGLCAYIILYKINPDLVNMRGITQISGSSISGQTPLVAGVVGNYTATKPSGDKATATMAYTDLIKKYATANGIPENIAFGLIAQESGGNPMATSGAGAMGLAQLMPATASGLDVTDPYNAEQSIQGGMKYLKQMYDSTGSWDSAVAAYNCGLTNFQKASTWENLPTETKAHVPAVMGYANWYSQQSGQGSGITIM